jgi:acyl-homoserine lactone acylase PvdQ
MNLRSLVAGLTLASIAFAPAPAPGDTGTFFNILPPGQRGYMNAGEATTFLGDGTLPPHFDDQSPLYDALRQSPPGIQNEDLPLYFKEAPIEREPTTPNAITPNRSGVLITRDEFGVPHIQARSRKDAMYGIGLAMATDRLFSMDLIRHAGRGRVTEFIGYDPFNLGTDIDAYNFAGYSEEDLQEQLDNARKSFGGRAGRVDRDLDNFLEGVNYFVARANLSPIGTAPAEYVGLDLLPIKPFTKTDIVAIATQLELLFGAGGGSEHRNTQLLQRLQADLGAVDGEALYNDLRRGEEPEAPVTTELSFPYPATGPVDEAAVAIPDLDSITTRPTIEVIGALPAPFTPAVDTRYLRAGNRGNPAMSNFVGITAEHAEGGHPIAVMGPQTGYFVPQLLSEYSVDGGKLFARGVAVTGTPYIVLGRGRNYAWSATAGGSDNTDVRVVKLCVPGGGSPAPDAIHYEYQGECREMFVRVDTWCAGGPGFCSSNPDNLQARVERTVHGIVFARATVDGEPVALVKQRASFKREGENSLAFARINVKTKKAKQFERAIQYAPGSFNWLYTNEEDLFYFHSGSFPIRAEGVNPEFPSWGDGNWEWQGFVDRRDHPAEVNPANGRLTSWNNKPARDWRSNDGNYSFTSVHRVDSLDERVDALIEAGDPITIGQMVELMADAATVDLRGSQVLPSALALIGAEAGLDPILTILSDWVDSGAFRRDRDGDGEYDHATAVAIMDAWFRPMIDATVGPQLAPFYSYIPLDFDNKPGPSGSAYQGGYYGLLDKVLRQALGSPVVAPYQALQCADGTAAGCRAALIASLNEAIADLTSDFASADPADWKADPTVDQIEFQAFGLAEVDPIGWQNRPTFQQVVQVETSR